jgi:hypothetical protein
LTATVESPIRKKRGGLTVLEVGVEWTRPQAARKRAERETFMLVLGTTLDGSF